MSQKSITFSKMYGFLIQKSKFITVLRILIYFRHDKKSSACFEFLQMIPISPLHQTWDLKFRYQFEKWNCLLNELSKRKPQLLMAFFRRNYHLDSWGWTNHFQKQKKKSHFITLSMFITFMQPLYHQKFRRISRGNNRGKDYVVPHELVILHGVEDNVVRNLLSPRWTAVTFHLFILYGSQIKKLRSATERWWYFK